MDIGTSYAAGNFFGPVTIGGRIAVGWPCRVGAVPRLAHGRQPRPADDLLADAVAGGGTAVVCQVLAGMGGVGKTQLAANLAENLWQAGTVDLLMWVTVGSRDSVLNTYAQAAADITGAGDPDPAQAAQRLLAWLAGTDRRWLVVLDDVADPQDLAGLWPPDTPSGRTVVTTRRRDTALLDGRRLVDVGVFTKQEAADYLRGRLGDSPHRLDEADQLAADLGFLPLALAQAATYIRDQDLTCAGYRRRLSRKRLDRLHPKTLPDGQQQAVAETWGLSIELADTDTDGLAGIVLQLAAILDPNGIPANLFTTTAALGHYRQRLDREVDGDDAHDAGRALYRLGLADSIGLADSTTDPDGAGLLRVHALVQRVVREATPEPQQPTLAHTAAEALLELWPGIERDNTTTRLGQLLRANTTTLADVTGDHLWHTLTGADDTHAVLFRAGLSLGDIGLVVAARDHYERLQADGMRLLGPDHPGTLAIRYNLAVWRGEAGDPAGAAMAFEQLLADRVRVLGPDHPDTLISRGSLARWRAAAGDLAGAAAASEQLWADFLRVLGPDHPDTLSTRNNLAYQWGAAGNEAGAVAAFEQLLADRVRVLGPDHPSTLTARGNLALWRGAAGDPAGAAAAFEQLLADSVRVLGPDHPDTLTARHNLAQWRGEAGDAAGAVTAFEQLLADSVRVLGPDHPDTLTTRGHLAGFRGEAGDPVGAVTAFEPLLADFLRVLGPDHPDTLTTRHNLARWWGEAGDPIRAVAAFEQLVADFLRVLGPDHPSTLIARSNLAEQQGEAGDPVAAATAFEQLLADFLRVLGPDHPNTLTIRSSLALWSSEAADDWDEYLPDDDAYWPSWS
ncbi:tetratricopeptide repeat protein [Actinoplanes sp. NPDC049118]|uniref:tetratricopeptide repeat protein n=1 Tax=Actinoplanes sp. NPDC049118 TaxID=3155769 RepID=UPI0034046F76